MKKSNQTTTNTSDLQSPHWADQIITNVLKWQKTDKIKKLHVDDMKTPSGRIHVGSLEGVVYHDLFAQILESETDQNITSTYVFNDMDPMDGLPGYLDQKVYSQYMGKPLYKIPRPPLDQCGINMDLATKEELADFEKAESMAELYAFDFVHALRKLGCKQEIVWSHKLYESGEMDPLIKEALDNVETFRKIYKKVADYNLPKNWHPFQVFCPECGRIGSNLVTGWDGKEVTFECQPHKVSWAEGCGHKGSISPFGGNGKFLWKVDWPAHWKALGITIEGAGKDHTSAGGSRDMANAICDQIFDIPQPFDIPYEWILVRGAKMSSSKGVGTSAREFLELFPPNVGRFLFANKHYNQVLDFDPTTMAIPDLFDLYDQGARIFWKQEEGDLRLGRSFELSQIGPTPKTQFLPRFRDIAMWMQYPELDLITKFEEAKGSALTKIEKDTLNERVKYAKLWIERYAPEDYQMTPQEEMPEGASKLTPEQITFLAELVTVMKSKKSWEPADLQQTIFETAKASLGARPGFQAIYLILLGKTSGPRAGWLLENVGVKFLENRLKNLGK